MDLQPYNSLVVHSCFDSENDISSIATKLEGGKEDNLIHFTNLYINDTSPPWGIIKSTPCIPLLYERRGKNKKRG
jgi:hypothetical protein